MNTALPGLLFACIVNSYFAFIYLYIFKSGIQFHDGLCEVLCYATCLLRKHDTSKIVLHRLLVMDHLNFQSELGWIVDSCRTSRNLNSLLLELCIMLSGACVTIILNCMILWFDRFNYYDYLYCLSLNVAFLFFWTVH